MAKTELAKPETFEQVVYESLALKGDISNLDAKDKAVYMQKLCESLGLNPLTQPFTPLKLNGKEVLYASRACTDQLASLHKLTREIIKTERIEDVYIATAKVTGTDGRHDISTGVVTIGGLKGDALANALMKAETKAKRRATLCFCGLGFLDETEIETIPVSSRARPDEPPPIKELPESKPAFTETENQWRTGIERLMTLVSMNPSKVLTKFDSNPDKREDAWTAVMKTVLKKLIEHELWAFTEDGTNQLLEKFGITEIDKATKAQLEPLFDGLTNDGVLTRFTVSKSKN